MQIENERRKEDSNLVLLSYKANTLSTGPLSPLEADKPSTTLIRIEVSLYNILDIYKLNMRSRKHLCIA